MNEKLSDPKKTIEVIQKYQFAFQKRFGQNFLIDAHVLEKIVSAAGITKDDCVLEIGPGIGTMTQYLAESAGQVIAVEIDTNLLPILADTLKDYSNVKVINQDILKVDINELVKEYNNGRPIKVVANLPYYITTPILMHLLESGANIDSITVMVQKEVAEKLQAPVGTRNSGAITAAVNYYGTVEMLFTVPRDSFLPPPNVDSAVIRIDVQKRYADQTRDPQHFFSMLKHGFSQRRKTLVNALSATMHYEKPVLLEVLHAMELPETVRMENLTMEQLVELSNRLSGATAEKV